MAELSFFDRLDARARQTRLMLCVGLDPHLADLPEPSAAAALAFCRRIVEATRHVALAFKPNAAFFEALGAEGVAALETLVRELEPEIPVVLDAKRGDIASTAAAYATAAFERTGAGSVTLHPLLGEDSVAPFLAHRDRGVFLLCRTSNPGAAALQELALAEGGPLYLRIAEQARAWDAARLGAGRQIGLVVGATAPGAIPAVRRAFPEAWLLAPGVGAQGGDLDATVAAALRPDGAGLLVNVSRGIARAADPRVAAEELSVRLRAARRKAMDAAGAAVGPDALPAPLRSLADGLLDAGCVRFGRFTLKSGLISPIYLDLRRLSGHPALLAQAADAYVALLRDLRFDRLAALPYAGLPIGTAVALRGGLPLCFPRKEAKAHGTRATIEGPHDTGETVAVIDDLATRGTSAIEALPKLREAGLTVRDLVVLVDRDSGARERLAGHGVTLHAVFTLRQLLAWWHGSGRLDDAQLAEVLGFLDRPEGP